VLLNKTKDWTHAIPSKINDTTAGIIQWFAQASDTNDRSATGARGRGLAVSRPLWASWSSDPPEL